MSDILDTSVLPLYIVKGFFPVEDEQGNLIDFELDLIPGNLIAEVVDASMDPTDFELCDKNIQISDGAIEIIDAIKLRYGIKNLIDVP